MKKHRIASKFRLRLLICLLTFGVLFSCSNPDSKQDHEETTIKAIPPIAFDFDQIRERGTLKAVLDNSSTGYFIYKGQPMGYEYDLLSRMAKDLDIKLEITLTADIEEAFLMLNRGEADIMAYHLTVTKERAEHVSFTKEHNEVRQVLIQRLPESWRQMKEHEIEASLVRNPLDLEGKTVHTRRGSAFASRLKNLSDEIGGEIEIVETEGEIDTEVLIKRVVDGEIDYTVADEDVGMINATYYTNIDAKTEISFPQKIAWAVRKNAPELLSSVNSWLGKIKGTPDFNVIYNRYFKYAKSQRLRARSDYSSLGGGRISPYDEELKQAGRELDMDWILLASQMYQESKFDPNVKSWAGAMGLMQLTSASVEQYQVEDPFDPAENIKAGIRFIQWLEKYWEDKVEDQEERLKFVLASYNVGQGHVMDAYRLTQKYDGNPQVWEDVAFYLEAKSNSKYYNDPVVQYGYCRGREPVNYVAEILDRYEQYKLFYSQPEGADSLKVTSSSD